jgi:hypothetical protein
MQEYFRVKVAPLIENKFIHDLFPENTFCRFTHGVKSFTEGIFWIMIFKDFLLRECLPDNLVLPLL